MPSTPVKVVFLDSDTLAPHIPVRPLAFDHEFVSWPYTAPAEVADRIADATVVITNKVPLRASALSQASRLKLIAIAATGFDNVDIAACEKAGIAVSNIRGYAQHTVPEHTMALILALQRSLLAYRESVKHGRWQEAGQFCYHDYPIRDLHGSVLGIIGRGTLGQATARLAAAFGMQVLFAGRKGVSATQTPYTPFAEVLARSDVISLHCPLTEHTRDLISDAEFAQMKRKPLLINTARGGLINETALIQAMRSGQISGAGVDVTTPEPPPANHDLLTLLDMPNFILTPHIGWASDSAIRTLVDQLADNIEAFMDGQPRNLVTVQPEGRA